MNPPTKAMMISPKKIINPISSICNPLFVFIDYYTVEVSSSKGNKN